MSGWVFEVCTVNSQDFSKNPVVVSVGIPTFNRPDGLRRTLECITGQTYKNLEIIVSDNCSPGMDTEAVVQEFMERDSRIQCYRQETNKGAVYNFQFVLEKATGKYFMWAADDDIHEREFISSLVEPLENVSEIMGAMCSTARIDESENFIDVVRFSDVSNPIAASYHMEMTYFYHGIFRTDKLRKFQENTLDFYGKDLMVVCEMILASKLIWINRVLFKKGLNRQRAESFFEEDPFCWIKMFFNFPINLLNSKNIKAIDKLYIFPMTGVFGIWVAKLYVGHLISAATGRPR